MEISSISGFMEVRGGMEGPCRDVYFLRVKGLDAGRLQEIERMDQALASRMQAGSGFYYRGNQLPRLSAREDADYYSGCYENWMDAKGQGIGTRCITPGSQLSQILGQACSGALGLLGQGKAGLSASIEKNFVVKLLFWLDQTVPEALHAWRPEASRKAVFGNISKKQEYLFCYLLTQLGFDVLLLQAGQDIDGESGRLGLSQRIGAEIASQIPVPEYNPSPYRHCQPRELPGSARGKVEKKAKAGKAPAVVDVRIPERDRRTQEMLRPKPQGGKQQAPGAVRSQEQPYHAPGAGRRQEQPSQVPGTVRRQELPNHAPGSVRSQEQPYHAPGAVRRQELPYEELALLASSVVLILIHDAKGKTVGSGSGIMIGRDGYILTNSHVASGGRSYSVRIEEDEQVYRTDEMIKYNTVLDLAILRIDRQLNPIPIYQSQEKLVRGQKVVAIGSPLGLFNSVSDGIISGFRVIDNVDMIQFTAPISHGSSGGAVLNMYGEVIGISTAGIDSGQNINLAVGYEYIQAFAQGFLKC